MTTRTLSRYFLIGGILFLCGSAIFTLRFYHYAVGIDGTIVHEDPELQADSLHHKEIVTISVISRYPPNVIYRGYQPLMDFLSERTPYRFTLRLCSDYNEAVHLLITKQAAAAFLGSYVYLRAHEEHGVIPILKPLNNELEPFSRSVLFTTAAKPVYTAADLRNLRVALPSPESFSSHWFYRTVLPANGLTLQDLDTAVNFRHHQSVIDQVLRGGFDAGVSRESLVRRMQSRNIRILLASDPIPSSPIVVARDYPRPIVEAMTAALLSVDHHAATWKEVTKGWDSEFIYGFVPASDADYEPLRELLR